MFLLVLLSSPYRFIDSALSHGGSRTPLGFKNRADLEWPAANGRTKRPAVGRRGATSTDDLGPATTLQPSLGCPAVWGRFRSTRIIRNPFARPDFSEMKLAYGADDECLRPDSR